MRPRSAIALALLVVVPIAGCGGDGEKATTTTAQTPTQPAGLTARVIDGDTREPLPNAQVLAIDDANNQLPGPAAPGPDGRWQLPQGAAAAYARAPGHGESWATIAPGRTDEVIVALYDPKLQSPEYGGGPQRTRYLPAVDLPVPAGAPKWKYTGKALLEFPPAVSNGLAALTTNPGRIIVFNTRTGGKKWEKRHTLPGREIAASPAIIQETGTVVVAGMDGRLIGYDLGTGRVKWRFSTGGSPIESSPLVVGGSVFVGAWNGRLYKVNRDDGTLQCSFPAADDVKGSPAQSGDNIVFGDYAGNVYAMRATDCAQVWRSAAGRRFYGGPAVSKGRIVIGDVGGAVVALSASNGRRLWSHSTGGSFVYGSPAIAGDTVFIGSYNEQFEALRLSDGGVKWSFDAGGRISGSATVVGDTVYTSVLARPGEKDRTYGLNVTSGKRVWTGNDGRYSPAVGAGRTLFIVGRTTLYAYSSP